MDYNDFSYELSVIVWIKI